MGKIQKYKNSSEAVLRPDRSLVQLEEEFRIKDAKRKRNLEDTKLMVDLWIFSLEFNKIDLIEDAEDLIYSSVEKEWGQGTTVNFNREEKSVFVQNERRKLEWQNKINKSVGI
jgi:hypothetical protein